MTHRKMSMTPLTDLSQMVELAQKDGQYLSKTIHNGFFQFSGTQTNFMERLAEMSLQEKKNIIEMQITITGNKIKEENKCYYYSTLLLGFLLIIPFFIMCCECWKRSVYPIYEISLACYEALSKLGSESSCRKINLVVFDNSFDNEKCQIIYNLVRINKIKSFNFENRVAGVDYKNQQHSNFKRNMKPLKEINLQSSRIQWENLFA